MRTKGKIVCYRPREEQAAAIYTDRDSHAWLFWHLQLSRMAALDAGEDPTTSLWVLSLNRALAALQRKDFGELERACIDIDANFNNGLAAAKEAAQKEASEKYYKRK